MSFPLLLIKISADREANSSLILLTLRLPTFSWQAHILKWVTAITGIDELVLMGELEIRQHNGRTNPTNLTGTRKKLGWGFLPSWLLFLLQVLAEAGQDWQCWSQVESQGLCALPWAGAWLQLGHWEMIPSFGFAFKQQNSQRVFNWVCFQ